MHHDLKINYKKILKQHNLTDVYRINNFLSNFSISLNSKKESKILLKDLLFKEYLSASILLSNNQVDITKLDPEILNKNDIDLVTYSFPCQGFSVANMGRAKGINNQESTLI
ncbi:DNA cytosine methyltransferase [Mycoplasmopsis cynos]|uniref:DNA cytosine methyltransferase n=1 Tax=Mycoplasmopsis cynos TaxID=171284 RepID=UPI0024C6F3F2|nr:DNA cytosine methyltransferase [Mycoplasmopsis cynos]WAM10734.1 DNA cytosine methyltransferase [Mycoplasmopsis cynos]